MATAGDTPPVPEARETAASPARHVVIATQSAGEGPSAEKLGSTVISGLTVERQTRYTNVVPTSTGPPNIATSEVWTSTELHVVVLSRITDFQRDERTVRLTNISRTEPDPGLFRVPSDYTVQNEIGEFRIDFVIGK